VETWKDTSGTVELSSGYGQAWSRGDGSYILSNSAGFDPRQRVPGSEMAGDETDQSLSPVHVSLSWLKAWERQDGSVLLQPYRAAVLWVDENTQIQAQDRTAPLLPVLVMTEGYRPHAARSYP